MDFKNFIDFMDFHIIYWFDEVADGIVADDVARNDDVGSDDDADAENAGDCTPCPDNSLT